MSEPEPIAAATEARDRFNYCPECGGAAPAPERSRAFSCENCGFVLYFNVAGAYGGLIVDDEGRLLVVRRARDPARGLLAFPGGFADPGETAEAGLLREVFEEVGLRVEIIDYLCSHPNPYTYRGITYPVLDLFYLCRIVSPHNVSLTLQASEIAGYEWRDPGTIQPEEIAFPSLRAALQCYLKRMPVK